MPKRLRKRRRSYPTRRRSMPLWREASSCNRTLPRYFSQIIQLPNRFLDADDCPESGERPEFAGIRIQSQSGIQPEPDRYSGRTGLAGYRCPESAFTRVAGGLTYLKKYNQTNPTTDYVPLLRYSGVAELRRGTGQNRRPSQIGGGAVESRTPALGCDLCIARLPILPRAMY